jgi:polysaccharide pyruvyl transferase WcaK-like protein
VEHQSRSNQEDDMGPPTVLLVGYNGANNTGAEALLQADLADLRAVLGPDARLTVPTLNAANLRRYLSETPTLRIAPIPSVFPGAVRRLVREHDLVVLVEGSAYMDTWTPALLWYFLWATRCAAELGKPCLAYAVDAGQLSRLDRWLVRREASRTELIVTRSTAAAERLRSWGVSAPITATADNAFNFQPEEADAIWLRSTWPEITAGAAGLALVDFSRFPVVVRPWGRPQDCYRWPYYFAHSRARRQASQALAAGYAALADRIVERHGRPLALIAMEELDEPLARVIRGRMRHPERTMVFSSRVHDASRMTTLLRSLDLLVTSRYHAAVLSMAAAVPQVAVGHDLRLLTLYQELGMAGELFVPGGASPEVFAAVTERVERLLADPEPVRDALRRGHQVHAAAARRNRALLRAFARDHGWGEPAWAA